MAGVDLREQVGERAARREIVEREEAGPQAVVDVVGVVGDVVGEGGGLRLGAGIGREIEVLPLLIFEDRRRNATVAVARRSACRPRRSAARCA